MNNYRIQLVTVATQRFVNNYRIQLFRIATECFVNNYRIQPVRIPTECFVNNYRIQLVTVDRIVFCGYATTDTTQYNTIQVSTRTKFNDFMISATTLSDLITFQYR